jgi:hypothetical protein
MEKLCFLTHLVSLQLISKVCFVYKVCETLLIAY